MNQMENQSPAIPYRKYLLSRIVTVREIISADYVQGSKKRAGLHVHQDAWELCCCLEGSVRYMQDDREVVLQAGQVFFTPPGTAHGSLIDDPESRSFFISFTCTDTYIQNLYQRRLRLIPEQERLLEHLLEEIRSAFELEGGRLRIYKFIPGENSPLGAEQMICCYLEQLLISILRELTKRDGKTVSGGDFAGALESDLAKRISRYIDRHLQEPLTVERLCSQFHYGRTKISAVFKNATGAGINAYITERRLEKAREMLEEGNRTVAQVAEATGFSTPQYFSRRFSALNGCSPARYAERYKKNR